MRFFTWTAIFLAGFAVSVGLELDSNGKKLRSAYYDGCMMDGSSLDVSYDVWLKLDCEKLAEAYVSRKKNAVPGPGLE